MKPPGPIRKPTKKERVITAKLQNPNVSLKIIAKNEDTGYGYARTVWAKYQRNTIQNKGGALTPLMPFPFQVQDQGFAIDGPPRWYLECPLDASANRNGQKVFKSPYYSVVFNKRGSIQLYVYHVDWEKKLREWLSEWMAGDETNIFFEYLQDRGGKHYAANAPGIPTGYKFTVPGIGSFSTDGTPYKKGTMEFEVDPGFDKRLAGIENNMLMISDNMGKFGKGMEQHMILISALQDVAFGMKDAVSELNAAIKEMRK